MDPWEAYTEQIIHKWTINCFKAELSKYQNGLCKDEQLHRDMSV